MDDRETRSSGKQNVKSVHIGGTNGKGSTDSLYFIFQVKHFS